MPMKKRYATKVLPVSIHLPAKIKADLILKASKSEKHITVSAYVRRLIEMDLYGTETRRGMFHVQP
jgi:hypothetical protein